MFMTKFIYNNTKNAITSHILFKLKYDYQPCGIFENKTNLHLKSHLANKLARKLEEQIIIYQENLFYAQKL